MKRDRINFYLSKSKLQIGDDYFLIAKNDIFLFAVFILKLPLFSF